MKLFAIHPTFEISAASLARAYGLKNLEWVIWDDMCPETYLGRNRNNYVHLFRRDNYKNWREELGL